MAMRILTAALVVCLTGLSTIDAAEAQFTMGDWQNTQNEIMNLRQQMDRDRETQRQQINQESAARQMDESQRSYERSMQLNRNPCNSGFNYINPPPC